MSRPVSNVSIPSHTFAAWVEKTNEMAFLFTTSTVTVFANTTGAITTGNAYVNGHFTANLIIAKDGLRGGTVDLAANLSITTNATFTSNVLFNTNINVSGLATLATSNLTGVAELRGITTAFANVIPTSNVAAIRVGTTTNRFIFNGNTMDLSGTLNVSGISTFTGNVVAPTANITVLVIPPNFEVQTFANSNLGSNTTSNQLITTISGTSYRSGKITLSFRDTANGTQISQIWYTSNSTGLDFTVQGVLYNGPTQLVSNTVAVWNAGTVEIYGVQLTQNTSVKGISELFRA